MRLRDDLPPSLQVENDLPPSLAVAGEREDLPPSLSGGEQVEDLPPSLTETKEPPTIPIKESLGAAWDLTPMAKVGSLYDRLAGDRLTNYKRLLTYKIETPIPQMQPPEPTTPMGSVVRSAVDAAGVGPGPSSEVFNLGVPAAQTLASETVNQIPTNAEEMRLAAGLSAGIPAVTKFAPKVLPALGKDVRSLFRRGAPPVSPETVRPTPEAPRPAPETVELPPSLQEAPPVSEALPKAIPSPDLPVMSPGTKTGQPHALFAYNHQLSPEHPVTPYYNIFGDPSMIPKETSWGSSVTAETLKQYGIPVIGREPRAAKMTPGLMDTAAAEAHTQPKFEPRESIPPERMEELFPKVATGEEGSVRLGGGPQPEGLPSATDTIKREIYDRFEPIKYAEGKEIAPDAPSAGGKYTPAYVSARTLSGRIKARGEGLLEELNQAINPLENYQDRDALNKIYSLRNFSDLARAGKTTSGITAEAAEAELAKLRATLGDEKFDRIAQVADSIADIQNNKGLDILVEGKVISPETATAYREKYPNYLRSEIVEQELAGSHPELRAPRGTNAEPLGKINKSFLKEKKGTEKLINTDVLDVARRSLLSKVAAAEKQKTIDLIAEDFGKEIGESVLRGGKVVSEFSPNNIPQGWVKSNIKSSNGKIYAVRKDVENMLQGLNREQLDLVTSTMAGFNKVFKGGATTYRAPFVLSNLFRDVQEFFLKGRSLKGQGNRPIAYAKGLIAATQDALHNAFPDHIPQNGLAKAWKEQGGAFGGVVTSIGESKPLPFRLLSGKDQMGRIVGKTLMLPFEPIRIPAAILENTTRLAEYARLKGTNLPEPLKILNSRDVTVDFEKMGDSLRVWNNFIPFLNASTQGSINIVRAVRDQPLVTAGKAAAYIVSPAIGLYAYNRKFENDDLIDPYIKDNFWYINTGATREVNGREVPVIWTIRKGEAAQLLSNPVRRTMEYYSKDKNFQNALDDYTWKGMMNQAANFAAPPALKVPFEEAANYNTFTQAPIVSERLKDVAPGKQFSTGTTDTARRIGEKTGISPVRLEHVAQGVYPASKQLLELSDAVIKPKPLIPRRDKDMLERSRTFQPILRTPSGYFSQAEDEARRFEQTNKEQVRTPAFLYEEARKRFMETRSDEDLEKMVELAKDVPGDQRVRINRKINQLIREKAMSPENKAVMGLPRKVRRLFRQHQMNQE